MSSASGDLTDPNTIRVAIIGCGIAGPLTAISLRQVSPHFSIDIFEAYPSDPAATMGAWVTIATNGMAVLDELGLGAAIRAVSAPTEQMVVLSADGRTLNSAPFAFPDSPVERERQAWSVMRRDLYRIAVEGAEACGVRIHYGVRAAAISPGDAATPPSFELPGGARREFDVVVGADGIRSAVRAVVDPAATLAPTEIENVGGAVPLAALRAELAAAGGAAEVPRAGECVFQFGREAFFGCVPHAAAGTLLWFANPNAAFAAALPPGASADARHDALVAAAAASSFPLIAAVLRCATRPVTWTHNSRLTPPARWSAGGLVLVGDAAHAMSPSTGQGVSQAAEDAVALAISLRHHLLPSAAGEPVPAGARRVAAVVAALGVYEGLRRRRTSALMAEGERRSSGKRPLRWWEEAARDFAFRWFGRVLLRPDAGVLKHYPRVAMTLAEYRALLAKEGWLR